MMLLGRRSPARLAASIVIPNMLSDSGARERPVCMALYSSTICRKIGRAIIAPPSAICCIICWEMPIRKGLDRNRSGSSSVSFPCRRRVHEPVGQRRQRDGADHQQRADRLAALLPHEDAEHDAAHAEHGEDGADGVDAARPGVRHVAHLLDPRQHDGDDHGLEQEADAPRQVGGDEPSEQRPDGGGDRRRGTDQRVDLLLRGAFEVAVDERLHGRQERATRRARRGSPRR